MVDAYAFDSGSNITWHDVGTRGAIFSYHSRLCSTLTTCWARAAQKSVEWPHPYSKTLLSRKSSCFRYSTAGYVYQGFGFRSLSSGVSVATERRYPYPKLRMTNNRQDFSQ